MLEAWTSVAMRSLASLGGIPLLQALGATLRGTTAMELPLKLLGGTFISLQNASFSLGFEAFF